MQQKAIFTTLNKANLICPTRAEKFSDSCRDAPITVYQDRVSNIIYLDPSCVGKDPQYYKNKSLCISSKPRNDMDIADTQRRSQLLKPYIPAKRWLDFGCGPGYQLRQDAHLSAAHLGVELNADNLKALANDNYSVSDDIRSTQQFSPELISMFHVLEHLDDPVNTLTQLRTSAPGNAKLIIEVPHARDWLLTNGPSSFKHFTLWSEHLILHTRQSLEHVIETSGWQVQQIVGIQRYPVWNHLEWFKNDKPSGIQAAVFDQSSETLHQAYEAYLSARDQTDTLVAVAIRKP